MPRLIVCSGPLANQEFPLNPGTNHIGRVEGNDVCLAEDSVSSSHCNVVVGDEAVTIIDLNSTNGTHVNNAPVQSARLKSRDRVRLGNLECVFLGDEPAVATPSLTTKRPSTAPIKVVLGGPPPEPPRIAPPRPPPLPGVGVPESGWCRIHPNSPAHFYCKKCARTFCDLCVAIRHTGHVPVHSCRTCGSECITLNKRPEPRGAKVTSFHTALPQTFAYPFKADGLVLLTVGTIFYLIINFAAHVSGYAGLIGIVSIIFLSIFGGGFLFSFMKGIITTTAEGRDSLPDWPDVSEVTEDIVMPFGQMLATVVFSFLPAIALFAAEMGGYNTVWWMWVAALLLGCLYYPMGLLSVAMFNSVAGLNPLLVIVSILRVAGTYAVCCLVLAAVFLARLAITTFLPTLIPVPVIPDIIAGFISLYLLTVLMRILGLLYLARKEELGWFKR